MKKKVEFIDKSHYMDCWACAESSKKEKEKCKFCNGTGRFKEDNYHLIYTDKNGKKIAFQVDSLK